MQLINVIILMCFNFVRSLDLDIEDTLVLSHIVRHGQRTLETTYTFPTIPLTEASHYPYGPGELTLKGKKEMYQVGLALKKRYGHFLGDGYHGGMIQAISSEYRRSKMSMQLILAGLFKPSPDESLEADLHWRPVPFDYIPFENDKWVAVNVACPRIFDVKTDANETTLQLYDYLSKHSGLNVSNSFEAYKIVISTYTLIESKVDLPPWLQKVWPQPLIDTGRQIWYDMIDQTLEYLSGHLVHKIHMDSQNKIDGNFEPKLVIYSGHDITLVGLLGALEVYDNQLIGYGSYLLIELHYINDQYLAKILLGDYQSEALKVLQMPGCKDYCTFEKFVDISKKCYSH